MGVGVNDSPYGSGGNGTRQFWERVELEITAPHRGRAGFFEDIEHLLNLPGALPEFLQGALTSEKRRAIEGLLGEMEKLSCHQAQATNLVMPSQYFGSRAIDTKGVRLAGHYDQTRKDHAMRVRGLAPLYVDLAQQVSGHPSLSAVQYFVMSAVGQHHDDFHFRLSHNGQVIVERLLEINYPQLKGKRFGHDPLALFGFSCPQIIASSPEVETVFKAYPLLQKLFLAALAGPYLIEQPQKVREVGEIIECLNADTRARGLDRALLPETVALNAEDPIDLALIVGFYPFHVLVQDFFDRAEYEQGDQEHTELPEERKIKAFTAALEVFLSVRITENARLATSRLSALKKFSGISGHKFQSRAGDAIAGTFDEFFTQACVRAETPIDPVDFIVPWARRSPLDQLRAEDRRALDHAVDRVYVPTLQGTALQTSGAGLEGLAQRITKKDLAPLVEEIRRQVTAVTAELSEMCGQKVEVLVGATDDPEYPLHLVLEGEAIGEAQRLVAELPPGAPRKFVRNKRTDDRFFVVMQLDQNNPPRAVSCTNVVLPSIVVSVKTGEGFRAPDQGVKERLFEIVNLALAQHAELAAKLKFGEPIEDSFGR